MLAYTEFDPVQGSDIWILSLDGDRKPLPFLQTPFSEGNGMFSPDGRWLAYQSNESGRFEIYVQAVPAGGRKIQVSTEGGVWPVWAPNGKELLYYFGSKLMAVAVTMEPDFKAEMPKLLIEGRYGGNIAVTRDGKYFLRVKGDELESAPTQLTLVVNWFEELRRRIPAARS